MINQVYMQIYILKVFFSMQLPHRTEARKPSAGSAVLPESTKWSEGRWVQNSEVVERLMPHEDAIAGTSQQLYDN